MYIRISKLKDHYISVDQARYDTFIAENYLDTSTIKEDSKIHKTTLPYDIIFTKEYYSTSDEQVYVLPIEYIIHYIACVVSLIYLLSTRVDLFFVV